MTTRLLLLAALLAAGCTVDTPDVCASFPNRYCIALDVRGPDDLIIDQLQLIGYRGFITTPNNSARSPPVPVEDFHLPVALAVVPPEFFAGAWQLEVRAYLDLVLMRSEFVEGTATGLPIHEEVIVQFP